MRQKPAYAAVAAIGSVLAAATCCLPIGALLLATGTAGASALSRTWRPYLMGLSVAILAFGFFSFYRAPRCNRGWASGLLLWVAAVMLGAFLFFPQDAAGFLADHF